MSNSDFAVMILSDQKRAEVLTQAFSDEYIRKIVVSTNAGSKTIEQISNEQQIPSSTCYRKVMSLIEIGLIKPDTSSGEIEMRGRRKEYYKTNFSSLNIRVERGMLVVEVDAKLGKEISTGSPTMLAPPTVV